MAKTRLLISDEANFLESTYTNVYINIINKSYYLNSPDFSTMAVGSGLIYPSTYVYLKPVINLKSDILLLGSGTKEDPYIIK